MDYPVEVSTPTVDLTTVKIHVNSVTFHIIYRYMCMDVRYFYLNSCMDQAEYIMIHTHTLSQKSS